MAGRFRCEARNAHLATPRATLSKGSGTVLWRRSNSAATTADLAQNDGESSRITRKS